ncbi:hypothetical protein K3F43_01800 [Pseudomonas tussilaginis]|nr:hypothetical protein K3F43_01800 [Pseudomonas sp. S11A 273]
MISSWLPTRNEITGRKLIPDEIDFSLPGLMPIEWSRFYASDLGP